MSTRYVWSRYTAKLVQSVKIQYREVVEEIGSMGFHFTMTDGQTYEIGSGYTFSEANGGYWLTGRKSYTYKQHSGAERGPGYIMASSGAMYYGKKWWEHSSYKGLYPASSLDWECKKYTAESYQVPYQYYAPDQFLSYLSSATSGAYPSDDESGGYYYKRQGSDNIDPASVALPAEVYEGKAAVITLTPGTGKVYDGTVSYTYQYCIDGGAWQDLGTTGAVSYNFQVPDGAATIQVRARAQDDLGFTSTTWVTSAVVQVTGNRPPSITSSSGPSGVDLGTRISAFAVQYTLADPDGDLLTVTEALDGEEQRSFPAALGTVYSVQITQNFFGTIPAGAHTLTITASDGDAETTWTATFTKEGSGGGPAPGPDDPDTPEVSNTTSEILIELTEPGAPLPVVHVVNGDIYSRKIKLRLYENGLPYKPPEGSACVIGWREKSGPWSIPPSYDVYNTIQDVDSNSRSAYTLEGNELTIELSQRLCLGYKQVTVDVMLIGPDGSLAHIWPIQCRMHNGTSNDLIYNNVDHLEHVAINSNNNLIATE